MYNMYLAETYIYNKYLHMLDGDKYIAINDFKFKM